MIGDMLQLLSWNTSGLCNPNRKILVPSLLTSLHSTIHILMLQELKADTFKLEFTLSYILPGYHQIISKPLEGRGSLALLIHPDFAIHNCGSIQPSTTSWASIQGSLGTFNVASIYGPSVPPNKAELWCTLNDSLPNKDWIIGGDFNFMEHDSNSTTQASLLRGEELDKWCSLKTRFGLTNSYHILNKV